jgi:hypothetical protein
MKQQTNRIFSDPPFSTKSMGRGHLVMFPFRLHPRILLRHGRETQAMSLKWSLSNGRMKKCVHKIGGQRQEKISNIQRYVHNYISD